MSQRIRGRCGERLRAVVRHRAHIAVGITRTGDVPPHIVFGSRDREPVRRFRQVSLCGCGGPIRRGASARPVIQECLLRDEIDRAGVTAVVVRLSRRKTHDPVCHIVRVGAVYGTIIICARQITVMGFIGQISELVIVCERGACVARTCPTFTEVGIDLRLRGVPGGRKVIIGHVCSCSFRVDLPCRIGHLTTIGHALRVAGRHVRIV